MKKLFVICLIICAIGCLFAYGSGYCEKAGCDCHQYYGGTDGSDKCTVCGHAKASHS